MIVKTLRSLTASLAVAACIAVAPISVQAYDGTKCKAPGNCWEPKPGYPAQIKGSKYDPKHNPAELNKQSDSIAKMEARNAKRTEQFRKTGKWVY